MIKKYVSVFKFYGVFTFINFVVVMSKIAKYVKLRQTDSGETVVKPF